jgi:hypothetical protein
MLSDETKELSVEIRGNSGDARYGQLVPVTQVLQAELEHPHKDIDECK